DEVDEAPALTRMLAAESEPPIRALPPIAVFREQELGRGAPRARLRRERHGRSGVAHLERLEDLTARVQAERGRRVRDERRKLAARLEREATRCPPELLGDEPRERVLERAAQRRFVVEREISQPLLALRQELRDQRLDACRGMPETCDQAPERRGERRIRQRV